MELGVAYLWLEDFHAAERHFLHAIKESRVRGDTFYGMAGAAKWCLDDPVAAVRYWRGGLDAPYAVGGIGISLPLLLWAASILRPGVFPAKEAARLLKAKAKDPRADSWPGPIAKFILGLSDEISLAAACFERNAVQPGQKRIAEFYKGLLEFSRGAEDATVLREIMRTTADTSQSDWSKEEDFLDLMWSEEFFVARHEASLNMSEWSLLLQGAAPSRHERTLRRPRQ